MDLTNNFSILSEIKIKEIEYKEIGHLNLLINLMVSYLKNKVGS